MTQPETFNSKINIFWFRRDLRLKDNCGLFHALGSSCPVLPVFIFDTDILDKLEDKKDRRVEFIHNAIEEIKNELEKSGSSLLVLHGKPIEVFKELTEKFKIEAVYTNRDYEPDAIKRDESVKELLRSRGIDFHTFKDQVIFERDEVLRERDRSYTIYSPFRKFYKELLYREAVIIKKL